MLTIEVHPEEVFVWYLAPDAGPNNGGYIGRVFLGGEFHDKPYDELVALGTGKHEVLMDERRYSKKIGATPRNPKDHLWSLFCYETGVFNKSSLRIDLVQEAVKRPVEEMVAELPAWAVEMMREEATPEPVRCIFRWSSSSEEMEKDADLYFEGLKKWHEWALTNEPRKE